MGNCTLSNLKRKQYFESCWITHFLIRTKVWSRKTLQCFVLHFVLLLKTRDSLVELGIWQAVSIFRLLRVEGRNTRCGALRLICATPGDILAQLCTIVRVHMYESYLPVFVLQNDKCAQTTYANELQNMEEKICGGLCRGRDGRLKKLQEFQAVLPGCSIVIAHCTADRIRLSMANIQ